MSESYIKFNNESDIISTCHELIHNEPQLDKALKEIGIQKRGFVNPKETIRRSKIGSHFTSTTQQIYNYIDKHTIKLDKDLSVKLKGLAYKADKVLRENIVLQSKPPLDIIRFKDVPIRYSYSSFGGREQRWGYGLHKKPFNEEGDSITLADIPPHYTQSIHNHTLSEFCLILGSGTEGIYYPGKKREKIYSTKKSEIFHFSATTPHTLKNPTKKHKMNMTFKQSAGLLDWRPATNLNTVRIIRARIIKGNLKVIDPKQTKKTYRIRDKFYNYKIEILKLAKGIDYEDKHNFDQYIFVINGKFQISHLNIRKDCKKRDFIVIDKGTSYKITTKTTCRLYTVKSWGRVYPISKFAIV